MKIQENVSVGSKTTMKIGGTARYFAELETKTDAEEAVKFSVEKHIPLIMLGGGANTVFGDGEIAALVCRVKTMNIQCSGSSVHVEAGCPLGTLINTLASFGLDLSPLAGIPGTVGGAIFGNAGQGPEGIWIDRFVESVTFFDGEWKTWTNQECNFRYRESGFKDFRRPLIIWETTLSVPSGSPEKIKAEVERLLKKRFESQPHLKTAGSCFKAVDNIPAWKIIDAAGLRGKKIGGVQLSEKHANFLINVGDGKFTDLISLVSEARQKAPALDGIEMRLYGNDGKIVR